MTEQPDVLRQYAKAKEHRDRIEAQLTGMGALFAKLGEILTKSPVRLMIADGHNFSAPRSISQNAPSVTLDNWPSAESIKDLLRQYYSAEEAVSRTEGQLSAGDRKLLGLR
ncbi:MAG: hypothetical protein QOF33_2196 [Thermomicrobiales bacterium]|jgi:hypothetical protein|nr:hypothetical protein [Thermomicrobiales bacterium]